MDQIEPGFLVRLEGGAVLGARRVVVATGLRDELPVIPGVRERWGRDLLFCPYCHAYEVRDQPIGVQEARGLQHLAASDAALPGWLASSAQDHATPAIRLLEAHGYERARWWLELERDLASPVAAQPPVPGVRLVAYSAEWDERARTAMNDAFRDHWGSQPVTAAEWASGDRLEAFRPDLSLLAVTPDTHEGERVVGFVFVDVAPDEWPLRGGPFGYVTTVGVRREARGQGLARTLLAHVLRALRAEGLDHAVLDVDAESPTGALGLYQSLGFTVTDRTVSLIKRF